MKKIVIVIPAYEPDETLLTIIHAIRQKTANPILIVNDGSGSAFLPVFEKAKEEAIVLNREENRGKGEAIKYALRYLTERMPEAEAVITMDADGQHQISDVVRISQALEENPEALVIGCRNFEGPVPLRSRFGNTVTKYVFRLASGQFVSDTQTGLRGFGRAQFSFMLQVPGERYEYEMNVLMAWAKQKRKIVEVPIQTVYEKGNQTSHFRAVRDSVIIYREILKFSFASFLSFCVDFILFGLFSLLTGGLSYSIVLSNVGARVISACFNFYLNKRYVFKSKGTLWKEALKYFALAVFILAVNTELLQLLYRYVIPVKMAAKIVTELTLFLLSLIVQKLFVFRNGESDDETGE